MYARTDAWKKIRNFPNPELLKSNLKTQAVFLHLSTISSLDGQLSLDKQKLKQKSYHYKQNSAFLGRLLWKVSLKILNSGIILKSFTRADGFSVAGWLCRFL